VAVSVTQLYSKLTQPKQIRLLINQVVELLKARLGFTLNAKVTTSAIPVSPTRQAVALPGLVVPPLWGWAV